MIYYYTPVQNVWCNQGYRNRYNKLIHRDNSTCFYSLECKGFIFVLKMISSVVVQYNLFKHKRNIFFLLAHRSIVASGVKSPFVYGDIISNISEGVFLNLYINIFLWNISMKQGPLTISRVSVSTDQAHPSWFYFKISWILMERRWFHFFLSPPFSAGPQK